jgi:hypothetical protein
MQVRKRTPSRRVGADLGGTRASLADQGLPSKKKWTNKANFGVVTADLQALVTLRSSQAGVTPVSRKGEAVVRLPTRAVAGGGVRRNWRVGEREDVAFLW